MGRTFDLKWSAFKPPTESSSLTHPLQLRMDDRGNGVKFSPKKKCYLLFNLFVLGFVIHQPPI
jgi:hypothetical protein